MNKSRFEFARRNAYYGYVSTLAAVILGFATRTIFIAELGSAYVGFDALLTNVLGLLSFLELGIGAAMSYSLYKPVAEGDSDTVRALLRFYKRVYRYIALAVTIIGLAILPLIPSLAQGAEGLGDLRLYYLIFLASNVASYFAVYKTSVANAEQRRYLVTNVHTVASVVMQLAQMAVLLAGGNYLLFLLVMLASRLVEQIFLNWYLSRRYSHYLSGPAREVSQEELAPIKRNVRALIWHKIGEVGVNQTDSVIIAAFVNVTVLGRISNYNLIISSATLFLTVTLTAALGSFGNAIATSSPQNVYKSYRTYRFAAFWLYGIATIGLWTLLTPFVGIWIGREHIIQEEVLLAIMVNFYMTGQRLTMITVKSAAGIWAEDKYLPLVQVAINLVLSLLLVQSMGVVGVYIGTLAQGVVATVVRPIIVYPRVFKAPASQYFKDGLLYAAVLCLAGAGPFLLNFNNSFAVDSWPRFAVAAVAVFVWVNAVFALALGRRPEARDLRARVKLSS